MFLFCSIGVKTLFAALVCRHGQSGDDVGGDLIFDEGDAVAQLQLALLQSLQPQQIGSRRLMQCIDRRIEVAVLLLQPGQLSVQLALILVSHDAT